MLYDSPIRPREGDLPRRWISDDYFDLFIWYQPDQQVHGFQLCYDKDGQERAVTWIRGKNVQHSLVDTGDALPTENRAPVLVSGGAFPAALVRDEFRRRSVHLSPAIQRLVLSKLSKIGRKPLLTFRSVLVSVAAASLFAITWNILRARVRSL